MIDLDMLSAATAAILESPHTPMRVGPIHTLRLVENDVWTALNCSPGTRVNQLIDDLESMGTESGDDLGDWVRAWARLDALFGYKLRRARVAS